MNAPSDFARPGPAIRVRPSRAAALVLSALPVVLAVLLALPAAASSAGGIEYTRIPNGIARASSSGDNRPPRNAFDWNMTTFWRNRTNQTATQYLEMDFNGRSYAVGRISLAFGNHYPRDYRFRVKRNGTWAWDRGINGNTLGSRTHVWPVPMQNVQAVRVYCFRYSMDDYFSVWEMVIER